MYDLKTGIETIHSDSVLGPPDFSEIPSLFVANIDQFGMRKVLSWTNRQTFLNI